MNPLPSNAADYLLEGKDPQQCALKFIGQDFTYGELQAYSRHAADLVLREGGRKGDRVLLVSDSSIFWAAAYLGTLRAGLICTPLSAGASGSELEEVIRQTDAKFAFVQSGFATRNRSLLEGLTVVLDTDQRMIAPLEEGEEQRPCASMAGDDDLAALMFTSGSTGKPRGVMISHRNIVANTESIIEYMHLTAMDRIMAVLPFHYCFGASLLHSHLRVGGSVVVESRFMYPEVVLQRMIDSACTGFAGVPSHFQILLRNSSIRRKSFPHLRYVQQAGGHLSPGFVDELQQALPSTEIFIMYGQTEATARLSYLPPNLLRSKAGSIGRGIPGVTLRVLDELGADVAPGQVGEVVARGDNVAMGYWRDERETELTFRKGNLYTGDLATVDEDGFIYIVDRAKDFLKCRGERVSCRRLEEQLLVVEDLVEAAVIGVEDEVLGEAVKAFVVPRREALNGVRERVLQFCKGHLAPHLVPKEVVVLGALPKNASGKVLKSALRAL